MRNKLPPRASVIAAIDDLEAAWAADRTGLVVSAVSRGPVRMPWAVVIRGGNDATERVIGESSVPTEAALHKVLMRHPSLVPATDLGERSDLGRRKKRETATARAASQKSRRPSRRAAAPGRTTS